MAQGDASRSADKGKGKAVENGATKADPTRKDKDGQPPQVNGKKEDDRIIDCTRSALVCVFCVSVTDPRSAAAEELSEEDQQLKNELDMLVERLMV